MIETLRKGLAHWSWFKTGQKLTGKALADFEAKRDVWQEVLNSVREIKAGGGKRMKIEAKPMRPPHAIYRMYSDLYAL